LILNWSYWNLTYLENNKKNKKDGFTKLDVPTCKLGGGVLKIVTQI